jgi:DNA-binding transcriptional MerR regulator
MAYQQGHPIRVVARKTGLTAHVIRVWEKRYAAVSPERTQTNRRCYADTDVERLHLLRRATLTGHSIGQIARLPTERLRALVAADAMIPPMSPKTISSALAESTSQVLLEACFAAIAKLDSAGLEETLTRAAVIFSQPVLIEQVIVPLMHRIGDLWRDGKLRVAHEHLTSAVVRTVLGRLSRSFTPSPSAPSLVVTTPAGQLHELGALSVAATAASDGWHVTYLGPSLPAEEIA